MFYRLGAGLLIALGAVTTIPEEGHAATGWLPTVNAYRASAGLPPVTEDAAQSAGDAAHAQYMVQNGVAGHSEDPAQPGFTPAGAMAAQQSNVLTTSKIDTSDEEAVAMWMVSPFHAVGIIDANLATTGYGSQRTAGAEVQMGAALNVVAGRAQSPAVQGAVMWPGDGSTVPLVAYPGNEAPDPLSGCAGFVAPTGLPIILETGGAAMVSSATIAASGTVLPSCEFDGSNYSNPTAADQANGRALLTARGAVVLVPRSPLKAGAVYTVTETVNAVAYTWKFTAGVAGLPGAASPLPRTPTPQRPLPVPPHPAPALPVRYPIAPAVVAAPARDITPARRPAPPPAAAPSIRKARSERLEQPWLQSPSSHPSSPIARPRHQPPGWPSGALLTLLPGILVAAAGSGGWLRARVPVVRAPSPR
ncbi:MAG: hypothetical protein NVSMB17_02330 [Candidatus Dormibacteria bacterium]